MEFILPDNDWNVFLERESAKPYFISMKERVTKEYEMGVCYPPFDEIFAAFRSCTFAGTKVVIIGQDPYIHLGQAHGLSFSVRCQRLPPSLQNIYKELVADCGIIAPKSGDLTGWARQGVLLLNSSLSTRENLSNAHKDLGWQYLTANAVAHLNNAPERIVYILWGKFAQGYAQYIDTSRHAIIESSHPSPMSAYSGFFGSRPFSRANAILASWAREPIDWGVIDAQTQN